MSVVRYLSAFVIAAVLPGHLLAQCLGVAGNWTDNYNFTWNLTQSGSAVSGTVTFAGGCSVLTWSASGSVNTSTGSFSLTASGSGCPATTFTYSGFITGTACDSGSGTWVDDLPANDNWTWSKSCDLPSGETNSTASGWQTDTDRKTIYEFKASLSSTSGLGFSGRTVTETFTGGTDSCFRTGDPYNGGNPIYVDGPFSGPVHAIDYYLDFVGYRETPINAYRSNGRAPCGYSINITMTMSCAAPFSSNVNSQNITSTTVKSCRQSGTSLAFCSNVQSYP